MTLGSWSARPLAASEMESRPSCPLSGSVTDWHGGALHNADVTLLSTSSMPQARTRTDAEGTFSFPAVSPGTYVLDTRASSFAPTLRLVRLSACPFDPIALRLAVDGVSEMVTVTPLRNESRGLTDVPQLVSVTRDQTSILPANALVPELLRGTAGVSVQQTSTSQASPFVRGLTGQHVVALVDGVRFNTATFRPGANQYLAFIDGASVDRVEVVRGPGAVAYGSDALGGTINVLTRDTGWGRPHFGASGSTTAGVASADDSAGASVTLAGGGRRWGFFTDAARRSHGDLRPGGGVDSRSVATRLLGLPSHVLGRDLDQTGYRQQSTSAKVDLRPRPMEHLAVHYMHGVQHGASRYDQLDGGSGNLVHRFDPQALDFGVVRYDRLGTGLVDTLSVRGSYNRQQDDRTTQSINNTRLGLRSPITFETNSTAATGLQLNATQSRHARHRVGVGVELYHEVVASSRQDRHYDAATGLFSITRAVRGRYPDGARYRTAGAFAQYEWIPVLDRLTLSASARYSRFSYEHGAGGGAVGSGPTGESYRAILGDATYQASAVWLLARDVVATAQVSRGFRAPNVNDRGTLGLSGNGFEVPPEEAQRLGAGFVPFGTREAVAAPPVRPLAPERLWNYEVGLRVRRGPLSTSLATFRADLYDLIERNVIVLPPGATGGVLGGEVIVRQDAAGAVYTALANTPVFVRTNAGHVVMHGAEGTMSVRLSRSLSAEANAAYVRGEDAETGRPPNLENGIPPLHGMAGLRWQPAGGRWWAQASALWAAPQRRLSANDLAQARIGGYRTASEIANFFNNGAVARGLVRDGRLGATGESVDQVIARVLGASVSTGTPLFTRQAGYAMMGVACGVRLGRRWVTVLAIDNVLDANYRVMGSGIDGPGRNVRLTQSLQF